MNNHHSHARLCARSLAGILLALSVALPGAAETIGGGSASLGSIPVPPEAHRVAEFLRRMGRTETADRFERDIAQGRVSFGKLDPGTNGQTGRWVSNAGSNGTEYNKEMLNQLRPGTPDSSPVLAGWAITVEHEYVHMGQSSPSQTSKFENPAWAHSLDVAQTWMRKTRTEMDEVSRLPDSPEKAAKLRELGDLMSGLRDAHTDTVSGIREGIADKTIDAKGPWPTLTFSGSSDIDQVLKDANQYGKRWTQDIRDAQVATERRVKQAEKEALAEKQRLAEEEKQKQEQHDKERQAKAVADKTTAEKAPEDKAAADQGAPDNSGADKTAAKAAADQAAAEEAARKGKEKAIAELRAAIPKARSAVAQLKALKEYGYAAQVEAELAKLLAQYRALTGLDFQAGKGGKKPQPNKKAEAPAAEGGVVTHSDGSRTVLTYSTDASGKRVPVTTEYDRNGQVTGKTTVDSQGRTVPAN